jgi:hypothetical protein
MLGTPSVFGALPRADATVLKSIAIAFDQAKEEITKYGKRITIAMKERS